MTASTEPYLQIHSIGTKLALRDMIAHRSIRPDTYDVHIGDEWVKLYAVEPRIETGGRPIRAVELYGLGSAAEPVLRLEALLLTDGGPLQLKDAAGEMFEIAFKKLRSALCIMGAFLTEGKQQEFECRLRISEGQEILGFAIEDDWRGRRALSLRELTFEAKIALIHTVAQGQAIMLERIP
ncbi:hypothetical protein [Nitrospira sp. BLG_1]|uniref:hypothetical protein n=1 Tax=Nitrospira sp. BLG_1 TaxID=3395883 RepID=UPI0039BCB657